MTIGENIQRVRESKGYSRGRLALRSNVNAWTIRAWEKGRTVPTITLLIKVADVLRVSLDELVGRNTRVQN